MKTLALLYIIGALLQIVIWTVELALRIPAARTYSVLRFLVVVLTQKDN